MADTLTQYIESLGPAGEFREGCIFQPEADLLMVQFEKSPYYAERIDKFLTVFKGFDADALVGFELKGIRHKIDEMIDALHPGERPRAVKLAVECEPHITLLLTFYMKESLKSGRDSYLRVYETARQRSDLRIPSELVH